MNMENVNKLIIVVKVDRIIRELLNANVSSDADMFGRLGLMKIYFCSVKVLSLHHHTLSLFIKIFVPGTVKLFQGRQFKDLKYIQASQNEIFPQFLISLLAFINVSK